MAVTNDPLRSYFVIAKRIPFVFHGSVATVDVSRAATSTFSSVSDPKIPSLMFFDSAKQCIQLMRSKSNPRLVFSSRRSNIKDHQSINLMPMCRSNWGSMKTCRVVRMNVAITGCVHNLGNWECGTVHLHSLPNLHDDHEYGQCQERKSPKLLLIMVDSWTIAEQSETLDHY